MNSAFPLLLAEEVTRVRFQWGRIQSNADWILPIAACVAILIFVRAVYRRDARELGRPIGRLLTALRSAAFIALLVFYLQPQLRTEREVTYNSRVVVLADTSLSMGLADSELPAAAAASTRSRQVAKALDESGFLGKLRGVHDVVVMRFDESVQRIASLPKAAKASATVSDSATVDAAGSPGSPEEKIDWEKVLRPAGKETRLGDALRQVIGHERGSPLAGIVIFSDGGQNAGPSPESAVELAGEAKIPLYPVGVGSARRPANVRVYELEAPERAHPGDPYTVTGLIQAQGLAGQSVSVQLLLKEPGKGSEQLVRTEQVILGGDGDAVPVKFQVTPTETGRRQIVLRVVPPKADRDPSDDHREAEIEIADRKTRVLLFAGGPSREYQFLKALLYRDKSTVLDVLLQTGTSGISQEAASILDGFPAARETMYPYDCVVAFDPRWQGLAPTQVDLLESWVGEQGGGLIVVAGPIYTGQAIGGWVQDAALSKIRALYPVDFHRRVTVLESETLAGKDPWPLDSSREGREATFLRLADSDTENERAWARFAGVYSCQPVRGPKPGATVFARFADPQAGAASDKPVYLAEQFYGSGRVFYLGSGEMWRLRRTDEGFFERFYTQLIRHVSQGRLLRQSSRGTLIVDKDRYLLGNTVQIRAQLTNAQLQPLRAAKVPMEVIQPDRSVQTVMLQPDAARPGMFVGQITVLREGAYRLELPVPESDNERLTRRIQVRLPDLERENPERNDKLLHRIAEGSGGKCYTDLNAALGPDSADPLVAQLKDRTRTSILSETPDPLQERAWLRWMMLVVCGLLCGEWLVRRLSKLA